MADRLPTVLVIDDEAAILETVRILLKNEGFGVHTALGGKAGLDQLAALQPEIVITDVRMPNVTGIDVLSAARAQDPETPVILMTAQASLQSAVEAVNQGAFYYLHKPFRNEELLTLLRRAAEHRRLRMENKTLKAEIRRRAHGDRPVGKSSTWIEVLRVAETVGPTESIVLLQGESGTGKEIVARYVHEISNRASGPFVSINCGALPESLLESELFGHVRGSFTGAHRDKTGLFAAATGGTFFLDEVGEMSPATQVKLLRVLQQREVIPVGSTEAIPIDARLLAATNRDLEDEIRRGNFRSDLYYRLNVISLHLPPLRERKDDIPLLADLFLRNVAELRGEELRTLGPSALAALRAYDWPGNVRELENALERAALLTSGTVIEVDVLPERVIQRRAEAIVAERAPANPTLETIERAYVEWVLQQEGGNKTRAAEVLGIDPSTLYRKLTRYGSNAVS
ncbi:MAG TPA: sigma-54 dependent transcriptional regulator [Gemmatimonadaceae bacterium]|nr:sigma-54 dependent transcriptional regulator [Gemmatimonadaceae bacterium]